MVAAAEMRDAAADHGVRQLGARGDTQAAIVHEGAAAAFGRVELVHGRVVDDAGDDLALTLESNGDRKDRNAVQEVGGAVQRIDEPAMLIVVTADSAALFHEKGVAGSRLGQFGEDDVFRLAVGLADIVARPLHRDLQVLHFAEVARQRAASFHRGLNHDVEKCGTRHAGWSLKVEGRRRRRRTRYQSARRT